MTLFLLLSMAFIFGVISTFVFIYLFIFRGIAYNEQLRLERKQKDASRQ